MKTTAFLIATLLTSTACTSTSEPRCDRFDPLIQRDCDLGNDMEKAGTASKPGQPDTPPDTPPDDPDDPDDLPDDPDDNPPDNPPDDPPDDPKDKPKKPNAGRGNGSEGDPDVDPGNSGKNRGGD